MKYWLHLAARSPKKVETIPVETKPPDGSRHTARSHLVSLKLDVGLKWLSRLLSDESLTKKAYLNALASILDYAARLAVGFLVNPLLVAGLGDYWYGVWQFLGRLIGYISPATGRPTQALKMSLANQQASTDYETKRRQIGSSFYVWLLFVPLLALLGGFLAWFAPIWLDAPVESYQTIRLAAAILVVNLILFSLVAIPQSVLQGENLGYKRMGLSTLLVFVGGGFTVVAVYFDLGLVGVAVASLAAMLLSGALFWRVVRWYVPWFGISRPSTRAVREFLGLSWWFLSWNLVMTMMRASDVVILGVLDSVELVTTYTLTKYLPETIISLVAIVVFGITPGLGGIIGTEDFRRASRLRGEIMALTWLVTSVVGTVVLVWIQAFLLLWVGEGRYAGTISNLLIVIMVTQFVFIRNDANIIDLTLNLNRKVLIGLVSTGLSLAVAALLVGALEAGIAGLCLGFILGSSILSVGYPVMVGRFLNTSLTTQLKGVLRPALVTVLLFSLATPLGDVLMVNTWVALILATGVTFCVALLLAFYGGLTGYQRGQIIRRFRMVLETMST